ncbi:hypothetical protein Q7P37_007983 [Cladosporium fusiforme]
MERTGSSGIVAAAALFSSGGAVAIEGPRVGPSLRGKRNLAYSASAYHPPSTKPSPPSQDSTFASPSVTSLNTHHHIIDLCESPPRSPPYTPTRPSLEFDINVPATPKRKREDSVADSAYSDGSSAFKKQIATPMLHTPTPMPKGPPPPPPVETLHDAAKTPTPMPGDEHANAFTRAQHSVIDDDESTLAQSLLAATPTHKPQRVHPTAVDKHQTTAATAQASRTADLNAIPNANAAVQHRHGQKVRQHPTNPPPLHPDLPLAHLHHQNPLPLDLQHQTPFWRRWKPSEYSQLSTYLRTTFDPIPLAQTLDKPVSEIQHIFSAIVIAPLDDEAEKIKVAVEKRMERVMRVYAGGGKWRTWGAGEATVKGEFTGVRPGVVELVDEQGGFLEMRFRDLVAKDREYVASLAGEEEMRMLERWVGDES